MRRAARPGACMQARKPGRARAPPRPTGRGGRARLKSPCEMRVAPASSSACGTLRSSQPISRSISGSGGPASCARYCCAQRQTCAARRGRAQGGRAARLLGADSAVLVPGLQGCSRRKRPGRQRGGEL